MPIDPWGKPYQYMNPGIHGEVDVFSFGADGQPGGRRYRCRHRQLGSLGQPARPTRRRPQALWRVSLAATAPGRSRQAGFTLIELLVALVIAAIIVSLVAVSGGPNPSREFRQEVDRLAQLLSLAREEAQIRGAPIRFQTDGRVYRFAIFKDSQWRVIDDDSYLRPRRWDVETGVEGGAFGRASRCSSSAARWSTRRIGCG